MKKIVVIRDLFFHEKASLGTCIVYDKKRQLFKKESLERGWIDNQNNISCIPEGVYPVKYEYSNKFRRFLWEIKDVPGRSECKFHAANYWKQLNGCVSLGNNRKDIDGDYVMDVTSSRDAMKAFHAAMGYDTEAELHVLDIMTLTTKSI